MLNVTLRQLEYLVAVERAHTIDGAAAECRVSPVAVGKALADLDRAFGTELTLRRRAKGVEITPAGRLVAQRARAILEQLRALPADINTLTQELANAVSFGVFNSLSPFVVPQILNGFAHRTPPVHAESMEGDIPRLERLLEEQTIDFYFAYRNQLPADATTVTVLPLKPYVVLPARHRLAQRSEVDLDDLRGERFVLQALRPARELVLGILEAHGLGDNVSYETSNLETLKGIVGRDLAVAFLYGVHRPEFSVDGLPLRSITVHDVGLDNALVVRLPQGTRPTPAVRACISFLDLDTP